MFIFKKVKILERSVSHLHEPLDRAGSVRTGSTTCMSRAHK